MRSPSVTASLSGSPAARKARAMKALNAGAGTRAGSVVVGAIGTFPRSRAWPDSRAMAFGGGRRQADLPRPARLNLSRICNIYPARIAVSPRLNRAPMSTDTDTHTQTHPFQAEVAELLRMMVHSVYSETEIFLRELISNASDACDRLRYEAIAKPDLLAEDT